MLLFELFPLFMLLLSLIVGVWLYVKHLEARHEETEDAETIKRKGR